MACIQSKAGSKIPTIRYICFLTLLLIIWTHSHSVRAQSFITVSLCQIRCLNEPDNLPCHKAHYINQIIQEASQNHQFIEIYPIDEKLHEEQLETLRKKAIQLTMQKRFYNPKGGVVDISLYQSILNAMRTEFEQLIDNHVPADIAVEIIINNLVYNPDSQTAQCPDCNGEPIPCHLQQDQASAVTVPHFQHQPGCEFGSPDQCRAFDLDDWVKPKNTGGHTCECGQTIPSGVEGTGGMLHLISGARNNIFCGRAAMELKEQLSDPENPCWQLLFHLAISVKNSHLAIPIMEGLISMYNATTIHQWLVAAQQHFPGLSLLIDHIKINYEISEPDELPPLDTLTIREESDFYDQIITETSPEDNPDEPTVFHTLTPEEIGHLMEFTGMSEKDLNIRLQHLAYQIPYTKGDISGEIIPITNLEDPRLNSLL